MKINSVFKSNFLKVSDLNGKNVVLTMDRVEMESVGQGNDMEDKPVLYFQGHEKGLVLNKTNSASITEIVGTDETDDWAGQRIVLHPAKTDYQGKRVDCIRVAEPPKSSAKPASRPAPPPQDDVVEGFQADDSDVPFAVLLPLLGALPLVGSLLA